MNQHLSGLHFIISQSLLHKYTHCGDHIYLYYGYQAPCMLNDITWIVVPPIKFTGGRFTTVTSLSAYILSFVSRTTGRWSARYLNNYKCAAKYYSVDEFYTSFYLHNSVAFFYCDSISHSQIIISGLCHITNWYCNNSARQLRTTWGILAYELKKNCR